MTKQIEEKNCKDCLHYEACCKWTDFPKQIGFPVCRNFVSAAGYRKQSEGEWIPKDNFLGRCSIATCSNCGTEKALAALATIETVTKAFPYCEKCGAKMKG